jgi:heme oxygenase
MLTAAPFAPPNSSLRSLLRNSTAAQHAQLDAHVSASLIERFDRSHYVRLLRRLHAFFSRWEPAAEAALCRDWPDLISSRSKLPYLCTDLRAIGDDALAPQEAADIEIPVMRHVPRALGSMYVIEGATLGGQALAPRLREKLGHEAGTPGTAYFESYGPQVPTRWRQFLDVLERGVHPADYPQAVDAAIATFEAMRKVFER